MQDLAAGRLDALRVLVERYQHPLRRLAGHVLRDEHAADDVAQDVFLRVYKAAPRYRHRGRFSSWLYRICLNLCRDHLRRGKKAGASLQALPIPPAAPATGDPLEAGERRRRIRQAVDDLPRRQRTAVVLHRYQELSHEQIAEITGWSRSAVESLLVRAYSRLRERLADLAR